MIKNLRKLKYLLCSHIKNSQLLLKNIAFKLYNKNTKYKRIKKAQEKQHDTKKQKYFT